MDQKPALPEASTSRCGEHSEPLRRWIAEAQNGSPEALGKLLEGCRGYLLGIANDEIDSDIRAKLGASDVVQDTLLEAEQDINTFRGTTEAELLAWVRRILHHNLLDARRYLCAEKRRIDRERSLDAESPVGALELAQTGETPSVLVGCREDEHRLMQALANLPADHREVIELRNWHLLSFAQIGSRMNRSEDAARKLWARAIERLQHQMGDSDGG